MTIDKKSRVLAAVAVILAFGAFLVALNKGSSVSNPTYGAAGGLLAENYLPFVMYNGGYNSAKSIKTTADLTVGDSSASTVSELIKGTCNMLIPNQSVNASSTVAADCAVTGVAASDTVFAQAATTTLAAGATNLGWRIVGANASSTAGFITFILQNLTSSATVPPSGIASSTQYLIIR